MNKTKLTRKMIRQIAQCIKRDVNWSEIATSVGVTRETLQNWRRRGKKDTRGIYYQLVCAIEQAEVKRYKRYVKSVQDVALKPRVTTQVREIPQKDGSIVEETLTKTEPPDANLALKVLERRYPDRWKPKQQVQFDWREESRSLGKDPDALKEGFKKVLVDDEDTE